VVFYRHEAESAEIAGAVLRRLRFPHAFTRRVVHLVRHHMFQITDEWSDGAVRRFIARVGRDNIEDLFELRRADASSRGDREVEAHIAYMRERIERVIVADAAFKRTDLAVDGSDVIETLGIAEGREIGDILDRLLELVLDDPDLNTKERLIELMRDMR
jgi:hypothetical protein